VARDFVTVRTMTERSNEEPPEENHHDPPRWGMPGPAESTSPTSDTSGYQGAPHAHREPGVAPQPPPTAPAPPGRQAPASYAGGSDGRSRSEEHTSELQSRFDLVCRLLLE